MIFGVVCVSGAMLVLLSCQPANESVAAQVQGNSCPLIVHEGGEDSDMLIDNVVTREIPLIDTRVPENLETATFALG